MDFFLYGKDLRHEKVNCPFQGSVPFNVETISFGQQ